MFTFWSQFCDKHLQLDFTKGCNLSQFIVGTSLRTAGRIKPWILLVIHSGSLGSGPLSHPLSNPPSPHYSPAYHRGRDGSLRSRRGADWKS